MSTRLGREPCDHSLRQTRAFLTRQALPEATALPRLAEEGGHCDREVPCSVEDRWARWLHHP